MSQLPLPPGFEAVLAARRARRRRRRIIAAALGALLVAGAGATGAYRLTRDAADPNGSATSSAAAPVADGTCDTPATDLVVASSPDTAPVLASLAADFSAGGADADGRCVSVSVVPIEDAAAVEALTDGWDPAAGARPDVWTPSASAWVRVVEARRTALKRPAPIEPAPIDPAADLPQLASTPIVLAMPRPMATALGWPDRTIGWSDIRRVALDPDGWGAYDHPEWGAFRLGTSTPLVAPAGLRATRATTEDWATADAAGEALTYLSGLITDESQVAGYNQDNPAVPLVAIYPTGGTQVADHPYAVLAGDGVTPQTQAAAAAFGEFLLGPQARTAFQAAHFRNAAGALTAADAADASDLGLDASQPAVTLDPPDPQQAEALLARWNALDVPLSVLNLVDVSGSMAGQIDGDGGPITKIKAATDVLTTALAGFTDRDEVGLWSFSGGQGIADYTERVPIGPIDAVVDATPRREVLAEALDALRARGRTSLYTTLAAAYASIAERPADGRRPLVVLITDGRNDLDGGLSLSEVLDRITAVPTPQRVPVMTIAFGSGADRTALAAIAEASGGTAFVATTAGDLVEVYAQALTTP